ncbi:MAG: hypothetical protein LBB36_07020 [Fibromonadaceae bacterium]|nr:hypothetical protein [Fibromonadaceae bacterium]
MKKASCDPCSFPPGERPAGITCSTVPPVVTGGHCENTDNQPLFCQYKAFGDDEGGCFKIENQYANKDKSCGELVTACVDEGTVYVGVTGLPDDGAGLECSNFNGTEATNTTPKNPDQTPALKAKQTVTALTVVPFGRSLHISSQRDATVSMFDLGGAKVYGGKVRAGNSVFYLERMKPGVYYAVVQAGSSSQRIQVLLK